MLKNNVILFFGSGSFLLQPPGERGGPICSFQLPIQDPQAGDPEVSLSRRDSQLWPLTTFITHVQQLL